MNLQQALDKENELSVLKDGQSVSYAALNGMTARQLISMDISIRGYELSFFVDQGYPQNFGPDRKRGLVEQPGNYFQGVGVGWTVSDSRTIDDISAVEALESSYQSQCKYLFHDNDPSLGIGHILD